MQVMQGDQSREEYAVIRVAAICESIRFCTATRRAVVAQIRFSKRLIDNRYPMNAGEPVIPA
jgi:hypothetical protein